MRRFVSSSDYPYRQDQDGKPLCRWCGGPVKSPRRTFCSQACVDAYLIRSGSGAARAAVFERDKGVCYYCGIDAHAVEQRFSRLERMCHVGRYHFRNGVRLDDDDRWLARRKELGTGRIKPSKKERRIAALERERDRLGIGRRVIGAAGGHLWEAHHLVAVAEGGGQCGLDGYVTACWKCHPKETGKLRRRLNGAQEPLVLGEQIVL